MAFPPHSWGGGLFLPIYGEVSAKADGGAGPPFYLDRPSNSSTISLSCVNDTKCPSLCHVRRSTLRSLATTRRAAVSGAFLSSSPCHQVTDPWTWLGSKSHCRCMARIRRFSLQRPCAEARR